MMLKMETDIKMPRMEAKATPRRDRERILILRRRGNALEGAVMPAERWEGKRDGRQ